MAHGEQAGYHLKLYDKHWKILMVTEGILEKQVIATAKREEYVQLMMDLFREKFCSYLFKRQSDKTF